MKLQCAAAATRRLTRVLYVEKKPGQKNAPVILSKREFAQLHEDHQDGYGEKLLVADFTVELDADGSQVGLPVCDVSKADAELLLQFYSALSVLEG